MKEQTKIYRDRFSLVGNVDTVDDVVSYMYCMKTPDKLPENVKLMFFRKSVNPDWETNE